MMIELNFTIHTTKREKLFVKSEDAKAGKRKI